jgi:hypothetical protein
MRSLLLGCVLTGMTASVWTLGIPSQSWAAEPEQRMLSHDVYFTLKDKSPEARKQLVAGCKRFLSDHPGTVWFAAGVRVEEHEREVNDRGFDVALHIVFKDKASHDEYQQAPKHHKFIEEFKDNWESVRVFDSWLDVSSHPVVPVETERFDEARMPRLPDAAASFAGMIRGEVVAKHDDEVVLAVEKVTKIWRSNKADDPEALVGKKVLVNGRSVNGHPVETIARFIASLKIGETVEIDVAHRKGEALTILELTEDQRERVKE